MSLGYSVYSLLDGYSDPEENVKRAKELGLKALNISDHGSVYGHISHLNACKKHGVKCILGTETYCCYEPAVLKKDRYNTHMVMWAKNKTGLYNLWKMITQSSSMDYFYYKPRIQLENYKDSNGKIWHGIEEFVKDGNIQAFSGHMGSFLSSCLFADLFGDNKKREQDISNAYNSKKGGKDPGYYSKFLKPNWLDSTCELALRLQNIFGKGNFFIELQNELDENDKVPLYIHPLIVDCLRQVSKNTGIVACASSDPHYAKKEDSIDQRLMVSVNLRLNEDTIAQKIEDSEDDTLVFFTSDNFFIHSFDEMSSKFTKEELDATNDIAASIEDYDLKNTLYIPKYEISEFDDDQPYLINVEKMPDKYLMYLCVEGAKRLKPWLKSGKSKEEYWERLKHETNIIFQVGLSEYFLIIYDICMACDNRPKDHSFDWKKNRENNSEIDYIARGVGRGSAAGCLISYLMDITQLDPLKYNLLFSRFYNPGRINKDNVSPSDIDIDVESQGRDWVLEYIKNKYGEENVAQIITFQTMKGRASIRDIFRVKNIPNYFDVSSKVIEAIPPEASIVDEIQHEIDGGDSDYNSIRWALDNSIEFQESYKEHKDIIDQAIRVENTKRGKGRHPSGTVVTPKPIKECFPMDFDVRSKQQIISFDMREVEKLGGIKIDILGISLLSKLKMAQDIVNARK